MGKAGYFNGSSEHCERSFAHVCDSGGMRRSWLRGLIDVTKRYVLAAAAHNLGRILRKLFGIGKPKTLQGAPGLAALAHFVVACWLLLHRSIITTLHFPTVNRLRLPLIVASCLSSRFKPLTSTGC